jgi:hypothetical protein
VIGAGASEPYGLPLGSKLLEDAKALKHTDAVYDLLTSLPLLRERVDGFLDDLRGHPARSIDAFLEKRQDNPEIMKIGRAVIAVLMGRALVRKHRDKKITLSDQDWLGEVIEQMSVGTRKRSDFEAGNSEVTFITFNFDSIIEDRLSQDVNKLFENAGLGHSPVTDVVRTIHVHGRLPAIPQVRPDVHDFTKTPYGDIDPRWIEWTKAAMASVHVVFDPEMAEVVEQARNALRRATTVCFLGFAYHADNFAKLGIPGAVKTDSQHHVFGSAYGLHEGSKQTVADRFHGNIKLGTFDQNCLEVLQSFQVFRD